MQTRVLFVISAASGLTLEDGTVHPTGYWAEEVTEPHRIFREAGWQITVATPGGVAPTLDAASLGLMGGLPGKRAKIAAYLESIADELEHPLSLADVDESEYDLVFYPGGHGPMEDLAYDEVSGALLARRVEEGRPLALVCHAPAAVLAARAADGSNAFAGRTMTGLSNIEERVNTFASKEKWLLQDALEDAGIEYSKAVLPYRPHVVVDGCVYTGQNPQSSAELATTLVRDLSGDGPDFTAAPGGWADPAPDARRTAIVAAGAGAAALALVLAARSASRR